MSVKQKLVVEGREADSRHGEDTLGNSACLEVLVQPGQLSCQVFEFVQEPVGGGEIVGGGVPDAFRSFQQGGIAAMVVGVAESDVEQVALDPLDDESFPVEGLAEFFYPVPVFEVFAQLSQDGEMVEMTASGARDSPEG